MFHFLSLSGASFLRKGILIILFLIGVLSSRGLTQDLAKKKIDSLILPLSHARQDNNKVKILMALGREYTHTNPDSSIFFSIKAANLAQKLNDELSVADIGLIMSESFFVQGKYEEAVRIAEEALAIYERKQSSSPMSMSSTKA